MDHLYVINLLLHMGTNINHQYIKTQKRLEVGQKTNNHTPIALCYMSLADELP